MSVGLRGKQAKSNSIDGSSDYRGISNRPGFRIYESRLFPVYGNQELEVFPVNRNRITGVGWMSEVTRGRVDNENNTQSRYLNISNILQGRGLYI